jgi:hypothetical protein
MDRPPVLKTLLKRGTLVAAANWQVVAAQFVAETAFKIVLAIPLVGGALLVVLLVGGDIVELAGRDVRSTISTIAGALAAQPGALILFFIALGLAVVGGSSFVFFVKGGTVNVLVAADRMAGPIERRPVGMEALRRASAFSIEVFMDGSLNLFGRYLRVGLGLMVGYVLSAGAYLAVIFGIYQRMAEGRGFAAWSLAAALCSIVLVVWIAVVNLLYLVVQVAIAADDCDVGTALVRVGRFLRAKGGEVIAVFAVVFVLVMLATAVSVLATAGLSLIAFVPLAGIAVLPLQAAAWLLRGLVFQYLGLTALSAYLAQYRSFRESAPVGRTAGNVAEAANRSASEETAPVPAIHRYVSGR